MPLPSGSLLPSLLAATVVCLSQEACFRRLASCPRSRLLLLEFPVALHVQAWRAQPPVSAAMLETVQPRAGRLAARWIRPRRIGLDEADAGTRHRLIQRPATCARIAVRVGQDLVDRHPFAAVEMDREIVPQFACVEAGRFPLGDACGLPAATPCAPWRSPRPAPPAISPLQPQARAAPSPARRPRSPSVASSPSPVNAISQPARRQRRGCRLDAGRRALARARRPHR